MPAGYQTFTGSADPNWRVNQLYRLGGIAQLLIQQANERQEREERRLNDRVKLAASAVAAGGDINAPAVQGTLADMRAMDTKPAYRNHGYGKIADLLELNFQAGQNDPELIKRRTEAKMLEEATLFQQSFLADQGTGPGINASKPMPTALEVQRHAASAVPGGAMFADTRDLYPDEYRARSQPPAGVQLHQRAVEVLEDPDAASPAEVQWAKVYLDNAPAPGSSGDPSVLSAAQQAVQGRFNTENEREDARQARTDRVAALKGEFEANIRAWNDEANRRKSSAGPDTTWEVANPRPLMPNLDDLANKLDEVDSWGLGEDVAEGLHRALKQAASKGQLARYWQRVKKRPEVTSAAGAG